MYMYCTYETDRHDLTETLLEVASNSHYYPFTPQTDILLVFVSN